ncbi:MAG TPA: MgtC/SapB family protein [Gammaproteobacteria bacterium]|nr:MgtC/SapB family protein [Gammaproteobacteria bacterium]
MMIEGLQTDLEIILRITLSFLLGGLIGWERELHGGISAGIRTYGSIALGSCVFGVLSLSLVDADPSRIAAQIVTGIGFLGGGVIFRQGDYVSGLTTAATLWATSAVGLAVAFGFYFISFLTAVLIFLLLYLPKLPWWKKISGKTNTPSRET